MATKEPEGDKRKVNDLVSRFERMKSGDDLKKHCEQLNELEEKYRSKHMQALEKMIAADQDIATKLQVLKDSFDEAISTIN